MMGGNLRNFKIPIIILFILITAASLTAVSSIGSDQIVDGLNSTSNLTQALSDAQSQNRTLCIYFEQDSCYYCDLFKSDVLSNKDVQDILNDKFVFTNVDINQNPQLSGELQVLGTPTVVFLDSNNKEIDRVGGYVPADEFLTVLKEI